jgi:hypothetical protein
MLPYVGTGVSIPVDFTNVFSDNDTTLQGLQKLGLVPPNYKMNKGTIDRIFSVLGIAATVVGLQGALKS